MGAPSDDRGDVEDVVEERRHGPVLRVRVRPGAARRGVLGTHAGMLTVGVGAPPEGGRATAEALKTVASWLGIAPSRLSVISGVTARSKLLGVAGETPESLRRRVADRLSG